MTRPLCPACLGTRTMGDKHPRPCTCCEDGHMRGIDDPTPEERRIAEWTSGFRGLGAEIGALVEQKQAAYGDSFGKSGAVMRILYPDGIPPEKLDDALTVVRVVDKLFRIATDRDALGESPWRDVAGYSLLAVRRAESDRLGGGA